MVVIFCVVEQVQSIFQDLLIKIRLQLDSRGHIFIIYIILSQDDSR